SFSENHELRVSVRSDSSFAGAPGQTLLFPSDPLAFSDLQQLSANLTWNFQTGSHWSHHFSGMESRYYSISGFPPFGNFPNQANRAGGLAQSTYSFRSGAVTAGYQEEVENVASAQAHRNNKGGFLDGRWSPVSRLTLSAGGRAEANTSFGTRVVPRAGAVLVLRHAKGFLGDTRLRARHRPQYQCPPHALAFAQRQLFPRRYARLAIFYCRHGLSGARRSSSAPPRQLRQPLAQR